MDIITGYIGEPHISSEQDRDINIGIVGEGSYVLATGLQMEPEVQTGNEVRIKDGVIMHQGCAASIKKNTYDSVMIANGSQGMKRTDLIVARYQRDAETNIESMNWVVIQGTPAETDPVVPEYVSGDIQAGDTVADMPMYKVHLDGLNITSIEKVFTVVNGLKELNSKIDVTVTRSAQNTNSNATYQCTYYPALGLVFFRAYVPSRPVSLAKGVESVLFTLADGPWVPETNYALYVHGGVNNALNARTNGRNITLTPRLADLPRDNIVSIGGFWFVG